MNCVKKCKLLATETIKFNRCPCNKLDKLQQAFHQSYNTAQNKPINLQLLDKIPSHQQAKQSSFSKAKFFKSINKCYGSSTLSPGQISWSYLKVLVNYNKYLDNIVNIANSYNNSKTF